VEGALEGSTQLFGAVKRFDIALPRTLLPLITIARLRHEPSVPRERPTRILLRFGLRGLLLLLLLLPRAARGRDDTVHPQVLDHLT